MWPRRAYKNYINAITLGPSAVRFVRANSLGKLIVQIDSASRLKKDEIEIKNAFSGGI